MSVDLPTKTHERFFQRCRFKLDGISMNKRIIQLVQADLAGMLDVPHKTADDDDEPAKPKS